MIEFAVYIPGLEAHPSEQSAILLAHALQAAMICAVILALLTRSFAEFLGDIYYTWRCNRRLRRLRRRQLLQQARRDD